jgi:hypothetical protein
MTFWILIILIPLLIVNVFMPRRQDSTELSYTLFDRQLDAGNIDKVTVIDGKSIEGELRTPIQVEEKPVKKFKTLLPIKDSETILTDLQA